MVSFRWVRAITALCIRSISYLEWPEHGQAALGSLRGSGLFLTCLYFSSTSLWQPHWMQLKYQPNRSSFLTISPWHLGHPLKKTISSNLHSRQLPLDFMLPELETNYILWLDIYHVNQTRLYISYKLLYSHRNDYLNILRTYDYQLTLRLDR